METRQGPRTLVCVSQSVCYHVFCDYAQRDNKTAGFIYKKAISYKYCVQKLWCEKQVNKPISKLAQAYIPRLGPLALCTLEAQEVTMKGVYRLTHAIY